MFHHWIWRNLLQVCCGILLVAAVGWLVGYGSDRQMEKNVRQGWLMVRSPGNLQTVTMFKGDVWAGGINGLFRFGTKTAEPLPLPPGSSEIGAVNELLTDREGNLWVGRQQGASFYNGEKWEKLAGLPRKNEPVTALLQDQSGHIWLGLADGVWRNDAGAGEFYPLKMGPVDVLYQDRQGQIWAGSSDPRLGGLASFDGRQWKHYGVRDGLAHPSVTCVTETQDGTLWIGTGFANEGGANYFMPSGKLAALTRKDGLAGDKVRLIYQDKAGNIWFASEYDGVAVFRDGKRVALLTTADGLAGQEVKKIVQEDSGIYWLATEQGLNRIATIF